MITLTNFCQHRDECIPKPRCSYCVPHNIAKYRFGVRQPSCRFSHRPVRFYISRASMEAPAALNNQSLESAVNLAQSSASISSVSHTRTAPSHTAHGAPSSHYSAVNCNSSRLPSYVAAKKTNPSSPGHPSLWRTRGKDEGVPPMENTNDPNGEGKLQRLLDHPKQLAFFFHYRQHRD